MSSIGSADSFESFGSMGAEEAILILNPCDYTIFDFERNMNIEYVDSNQKEDIVEQNDMSII